MTALGPTKNLKKDEILAMKLLLVLGKFRFRKRELRISCCRTCPASKSIKDTTSIILQLTISNVPKN